ncbi:hypothetical protein MMC30_000808 [Trapelia coarctata]|nr:hypothetical protein [Trapelia coarctata]
MDLNDDDIPSYEESVQQGATGGSAPVSKGKTQSEPQSLTQQLSNVRSHRINSIISTYIDPLLEAQSLSGLFKTTFVLVPSSTHALQRLSQASDDSSDIVEGYGDAISNGSYEAIVGFPSQDYVKMVRLHGEEYTLEFWRQPVVIKELDTALKARLQASGHSIFETGATSQQSQPTSLPVESPKAKKGFFSRKSTASPSLPPPPPCPVSGGGWRFEKEDVLDPGHVRVKVGLQDVCLRVVTEMGLYETRTGKAVVVNMEIGS